MTAIPTGRAARARLELDLVEPVRVDLEPFVLRLSVCGVAAAPGEPPAVFEFEVPWVDR